MAELQIFENRRLQDDIIICFYILKYSFRNLKYMFIKNSESQLRGNKWKLKKLNFKIKRGKTFYLFEYYLLRILYPRMSKMLHLLMFSRTNLLVSYFQVFRFNLFHCLLMIETVWCSFAVYATSISQVSTSEQVHKITNKIKKTVWLASVECKISFTQAILWHLNMLLGVKNLQIKTIRRILHA